MQDNASIISKEEEIALAHWSQGDYSLHLKEFAYVSAIADGGGGVEIDIDDDKIIGCVVITQTCDIVRYALDRSYVVVCPLIEVLPEAINVIKGGSSAQFVPLELAPINNCVVDLGRMMTISKKLLVQLGRHPGFSSDFSRQRFANALERKHGRFAFPDDFSDITLKQLRDKAKSRHGKESDQGQAYRSILSIRVQVTPNWSAGQKIIQFKFVLDEENQSQTLQNINTIIGNDIGKIALPDGYIYDDPSYVIRSLNAYTATEWLASHQVDLDFISTKSKRTG